MLSQFIGLIRQWIDKAIYVWGGQGHRITSPDQIRRMETSTTNANRAIALWEKRGKDCIAFDCSGLVLWPLQQLGLFPATADMKADGLYRKAQAISKADLRIGDLVFKINSSGVAYHVGIVTRITDGTLYVTEARGRDAGVVENAIGTLWHKFGRNPYIDTTGDDDMIIKIGDKDTGLVRPWQEALIKLGFSVGDKGADDWFGSKTEQGTKDFQARFGLPQTGIVDAATAAKAWDALRLIPNVDVGPYNEKIAQLQRDLNQVKTEAFLTTGELQTIATILKKYQP